jgi:HlyD family secretion protein
VIFVRNENSETAEIRVVKTGIQDDKFIQITEGVSENEEIITGPYEVVAQSLKPGDKIKVRSGTDQTETGK